MGQILKPVLRLSGLNGNIFNLLNEAKKVAEENNLNWIQIQHKCFQGDYNNAIGVLSEYFEIQ